MKEVLHRAYVAGFIDGDGSMGAYGPRHSDILVAVCNVYKPVLEMLQKQFGGSLRSRPLRPTPSGYHGKLPLYEWRIHGQKALNVLRYCFSHLVVKQKQAELLLSLNILTHKEYLKARPYRVSKDELAHRKEVATQIKLLNQCGVD